MSFADLEVYDLDEAVEQAGHATLRERLEGLRDALEHAPEHFGAEVRFGNLVHVHISSSQHWTKEGELGTDRFRVTLGPHGGLRVAEWRDEFSGFEIDWAEKYRVRVALRRLHEEIRDAS